MGNLYNFKCDGCGFTAECSHGKDRGFVAVVQPLFCSKCKTLKNIRIGSYVADKSQLTGYRIDDVMPVCDICKESKYLRLWDGMTCPICQKSPLWMKDAWICWD